MVNPFVPLRMLLVKVAVLLVLRTPPAEPKLMMPPLLKVAVPPPGVKLTVAPALRVKLATVSCTAPLPADEMMVELPPASVMPAGSDWDDRAPRLPFPR